MIVKSLGTALNGFDPLKVNHTNSLVDEYDVSNHCNYK